MSHFRPRLLPFVLSALLMGGAIHQAQAVDAAVAAYSGNNITWQAQVVYDFAFLRVVGPNGYLFEEQFGKAQPSFRLVGGADGQYKYELVFGKAAVGDRERGSSESVNYSGSFLVAEGNIKAPSSNEPASSGGGAKAADSLSTAPDIVNADDLIVQGSLCVGFDCVNGESFGFDTIRLKENNTRIKFDDTSASAGFPANDWQLTANDSASGGLNKFSIEDVTGAKIPFTVEAGAATNSLYIDSTSKVGLRTSTPVLDLHVATGDTPAFRLEQNSSGGWTAQTWDIAGNEANFFIRDVTGGSRLPLRIRPGAPTSSIDIAANGNVGIGASSPGADVEVKRTGATTDTVLRLRNDLAAWDLRNIASSGNGRLLFTDDTTGVRVPFKIAPNGVNNLLRVAVVNTSTVDVNGTLTVNGTFNNFSSRGGKDLLSMADMDGVLGGIANLPLYTWSYKNEGGVRHFGPVAEDFFSLFGLGTDDKHISPSDMAGVALAAAQALKTLVDTKDKEIQDLKNRLLRLEELLQGRLIAQPGR